MVKVVAIGYGCADVYEHAPVHLFERLERADLERLVALGLDCRDREETMLVLHPAWAAEPTLERLELLRGCLETNRMTAQALPHAPLAGAVLVSLIAAAAPILADPGRLLGAIPALGRQLLELTWLSRVSGLERPNPTVWQHLLSYWPPSRFVAASWPRPAVRRITRKRSEPRLPSLPAGTVGLALTDVRGDRGWIETAVRPALGHPELRERAPSASARAWWGAPRFMELVAFPLDLVATVRIAVAAAQSGRCAWCRQDAPVGRCPFCGDTRTDERTAVAA
ncbi:MAG: hypothetical protein ACR2MA_03040 [Egibacteraceae bacterium]